MLDAREITLRLKGKWHGTYGLALCPAHDDGKSPALSIKTYPDGPGFKCHAGCPDRAVKAELRKLGLLPDDNRMLRPDPVKRSRPAAVRSHLGAEEPAKAASDAAFISRVIEEARAISDTPAERYLRWRGCAMPAAPDVLQFHPSIWHSEAGQHVPAMIARITDALDPDRLLGLHLTALTKTGEGKPAFARRKWIRGRMAGGVIRLSPDEDVTLGLAVAEGIETALVALADGVGPVWAAVSAGNLGNLPVLPPLALTVLADHDPAGLAHAAKLVDRWRAAGLTAVSIHPPEFKTDWADCGVSHAA